MEFFHSWEEEKRSAYLYAIMAAHEKNLLNKKLFLDLKAAAEKQAHAWEKKVPGSERWIFKPSFRTALVAFFIKMLGPGQMNSILSTMKIRGMSVFKRYHSENKHTSFNASSNLRAAVFGINDGLISNMGLILGMAGASASSHIIVMTGLAGLLAGATSMAAGEYISVRSQREVFEYQIALEKQELEEYPEEEIEELSLIYQARGVPLAEANNLARIMIENPETGLDTLAREELGLNPEDLVSPYGAMFFSFISFALGAILPLLPFLISHTAHALFVSITITCITLFSIGLILSLFTNRSPLFLGLRMLFIGAVAGALTYSIGRFVGINIY